MKDFFIISLKNLRRRKLRSWLTILGIFIGIAAVVSLISLGQGLKQAVTGQFSSLSADMLTIQNAGTGFGPPGSTVVNKLTEHDLKLIESVNGVEEVIGRLIRMISLEYNKNVAYTYVASMPEDQKKLDIIYGSFSVELKEGRLLKTTDSGKVLIGASVGLKEQFGREVQVGDNIKLQGKYFEVIGRLESSSSFQINSAIMMMESDLKEILNIGDEIDLIVAKISSTDEVKSASEAIKQKLRKDRNLDIGEEDFAVQTPLQAVSSITTILNIINIVIAGIAAISLLIGGIGIANTMYTSVLERTKEIGTMKAIGAKNSDVLLIFLIESGMLGLVGGIIGSLIGIGFALSVSFIANSAFKSTILSVNISYPLVIAAISFSFLVGILSGILPAIQASKLKSNGGFASMNLENISEQEIKNARNELSKIGLLTHFAGEISMPAVYLTSYFMRESSFTNLASSLLLGIGIYSLSQIPALMLKGAANSKEDNLEASEFYENMSKDEKNKASRWLSKKFSEMHKSFAENQDRYERILEFYIKNLRRQA